MHFDPQNFIKLVYEQGKLDYDSMACQKKRQGSLKRTTVIRRKLALFDYRATTLYEKGYLTKANQHVMNLHCEACCFYSGIVTFMKIEGRPKCSKSTIIPGKIWPGVGFAYC